MDSCNSWINNAENEIVNGIKSLHYTMRFPYVALAIKPKANEMYMYMQRNDSTYITLCVFLRIK